MVEGGLTVDDRDLGQVPGMLVSDPNSHIA